MSTVQDSTGTNFRISSSRSTTSRRATDDTRPAPIPFWTLLHRNGLSRKPTSRSTTRRACWALTSRMSISRGASSALRTASAVISWNSIRFGERSLSTSARCQAIASPSRSGSEARMTFWRSFLVAEVSSLIVLRRLSTTS
jgi:hypothetical protein